MSQFSYLPKPVQALIFSLLPPLEVARARLIDKKARDAIDTAFFTIRPKVIGRYHAVLPKEMSDRKNYLQAGTEVSFVLAYMRIAIHRRYVKDNVLPLDTRSQQGKDRIKRCRKDGVKLVKWLHGNDVDLSIQRMQALSEKYEAAYELSNQVDYQLSILTQLLADDDSQCDLMKSLFSSSHVANFQELADLIAAREMLISFASCGAQLCLEFFLRKLRKQLPDFSCVTNDLFYDLMRHAIKFGHVGMVRQLLDFGVPVNALLPLSDVNPSSGVTALTCVVDGVKLYVMDVYPELKAAKKEDYERLEKAFARRMLAYHSIIELLVKTKCSVDEKYKLNCLLPQPRYDSIGVSDDLQQYSVIATNEYAIRVYEELTRFFKEDKEQESSSELRIKATNFIKHALGLLLPPPTLERQESAESAPKRCKR